MTKKRGDDQYGYDPEGAAARTLLDRLEQRAEQRPDKPARKLGDVLKLPKITPTTKRLIEAKAAIIDGPADDIAFSHSVLCQTSLPYRPTDERVWIRDQGQVSLLIEAGRARHPDTGKWVELPLPHGEKPRLVMLHLNSEAKRTGSPIIDVEGSMTAFVRSLGIHAHGRNIRTLRDQVARLAAAHITLGIGSKTIKTDVIDAFDLWWPDDAKQRTMWPSTVQLAPRYFDSLMEHAVPLDSRAVAALAHSALDLDIYAWLAQRLHRIPNGKPQTITWQAIKSQFGPDYDRLRKFREKFVPALKAVLTVYPSARIEIVDAGLMLWNSPPPILKKLVSVPRLSPLTIDTTATEIPDV
ncbi:hypothetical protein SAE02_76430 [Skermanella aerolata]|uniref:Plasmid encoded RepA protein n=1 Tax=Skermanella aerolata TaxID=393310 RepID=A0A512E466_9PROT|nr:replication protein RepA [Skermanella aerolata]KJB90003.1 hypothetical protein N826_08695 [Skermanella aerolata KACC 11604]GEO43495.1 hypothetical protein SAE02_76430 [Skermanella aerolata]